MRFMCRFEVLRIDREGTFPSHPLRPLKVGDEIDFVVTENKRTPVGRSPGSDVLLEAVTVSRLSAYFELVDGHVAITDISEQGATVNGGPRFPTKHRLANGDIVEIFPFVLRFTMLGHGR